jgi:hypothetical protein
MKSGIADLSNILSAYFNFGTGSHRAVCTGDVRNVFRGP